MTTPSWPAQIEILPEPTSSISEIARIAHTTWLAHKGKYDVNFTFNKVHIVVPAGNVVFTEAPSQIVENYFREAAAMKEALSKNGSVR